MGRPFDEDLYNSATNSCDLYKDLALLPNGDETLLGDRGFTLSGGQRARLCLARAVYSNSDIVLLDDPLSAVDAEVANHLFNECICKALKNKTVLLATHQVHFMQKADKILVLSGGDQVFFGNFEEIKERQDIKEILGDFAFTQQETEVKKQTTTKIKQETHEKLKIDEEEITEGAVGIKSFIKY